MDKTYLAAAVCLQYAAFRFESAQKLSTAHRAPCASIDGWTLWIDFGELGADFNPFFVGRFRSTSISAHLWDGSGRINHASIKFIDGLWYFKKMLSHAHNAEHC